ncbi:Acetyltransferase (GNAT) family protein [Chitinophaga jiangningensis]|uniref:Acetyltransferase (GNAT) family protein n=1 Tax=Chitinophaga jiangningensis TaxID=1419482 RepID=A0A1M7K9H7_9BACT|nr:GNAT family N-acetyltransferase [Chitinophaga jiangningensis]SHM61952.1 Acetyltransferase (GNAT) family protein [Chitinophaga jiangningensis]
MSAITLADIQIRNTLQPGDLGYIAFIHGDLYAKECGYGLNFEAYVLDGLGDFAREYNPQQDKVWICLHHNRIIGSLVAQHRAEKVQLRYFIFLPEYRGIGLGKHLMLEFNRFMQENGIKHAYLWTTAEQQAAISLYNKSGFQLTEESTSDSFDKPVTERRYDLILPSSSPA